MWDPSGPSLALYQSMWIEDRQKTVGHKVGDVGSLLGAFVLLVVITLSVACAPPTGGSASSSTALANGAAATTTSAFSSCATFSISPVLNYNIFVFGDLTQPSGEIQGSVAVGGDAYFSDVSIGGELAPDASRTDLLVGGNLTFPDGAVLEGNAVYDGTDDLTAAATFFGGISASTQVALDAQSFSMAQSAVYSLSAALASLPAQYPDFPYASKGVVSLEGTDSLANVYSMSADDLGHIGGLNITAPAGSIVVINIFGSSPSLSGFATTLAGVDSQHVLFHFPDATSLYIGNITVEGSIIAPQANVIYSAGQVMGQLIALSLYSQGQFNWEPYLGCLPSL